MTPIDFAQTFLLVTVIMLWAGWAAVVWSQRKRLVRLWAAGVGVGLLWAPSAMWLMKASFDLVERPSHSCGTGEMMAIIAPVFLGVPTMMVVLCTLSASTLWLRRKARKDSPA